MHRSLNRLARLAATVALLAAVALGPTAAAYGDDWARDRAAAVAAQQLDPAIRTAIAARASTPPAEAPATIPSVPSLDDGFAWGAAALGLAAGVAGTCIVLGCVTLVRHDGRLRSA